MKFILSLLLLFTTLLISAQDFRYGKVSKKELNETVHPIDENADAAILYREEMTRFAYSQDKGFTIVTEVLERVKIYNNEGYSWATKSIPIYTTSRQKENVTGLKGFTYNLVDGKIEKERLRNDGVFEEEKSENFTLKKFTMPNIKDGSVIEYKYIFESPFLSRVNDAVFQEQIPINKLEYQFKAPEYFNYSPRQKGWYPFEVTASQQEKTIDYNYRATNDIQSRNLTPGSSSREQLKFQEKIYNVKLKDVPALKEEAFISYIENYASGLKYELTYIDFPNTPTENLATSWENVSTTIYESSQFGKQLDIDNVYKDDLSSIITPNMSIEEKIGTVFNFVKDKMTWNKKYGMYTDEGVRKAYKSGEGNAADINLMLTSMLKSIGLDANPIVISTKSNGTPLFPTRTGFNYVIASVKYNDQYYFLDATEKDSQANLLRPNLLNFNGRVLREDGTSDWVNLYPNTHAVKNTYLKANLSQDLELSGVSQNRYTGYKAKSMRSSYANISEDDVRKKIEDNAKVLEVSNTALTGLEDYSKPVGLSYDFESLEGAEEISNKIFLNPLIYLQDSENPFISEKRYYPIDFNYPTKDRYTINITIPEGYKVESLPESVNMNMVENIGAFKYLISNTGNIIQLNMEFSINVPFVTPEYYNYIKSFFDAVITKENEKVVLVKA